MIKKTRLALMGALQLSALVVQAETNAPTAPSPHAVSVSASATAIVLPAASPGAADQAAIEKHTKPILDALKLEDAAARTSVGEILAVQFRALKAWHDLNDAQLKDLWSQFAKARAGQDGQAKADEVMTQIDGLYATFTPQHERFVTGLAKFLTPEQVEKVKDMLTVNKVKVTYDAYGQIFHGLTAEQNTFILKNLKAAREEAIDAMSMTEKSAFFKKYKIKIEAYLTAQGYDVKQSYKEFGQKQKAEMEAKKSGTYAAPKPVASEKE
jgi:hypothetical protein